MSHADPSLLPEPIRLAKGRRNDVDYGFLAVPNVREAEEYVRALARHAPPV
jgi:hypothetical protein